MKTKKFFVIYLLTVISLLFSNFVVYSDAYRAAAIKTAAVPTANNYSDFYSLISKAVNSKSPVISVKISKYDKKIYDVAAALGKVLENSKDLKYTATQYKTSIKTSGASATLAINLTYGYVDKYAGNYNEFNRAVSDAAANLQDFVKIRINKYDPNVYKTSTILEQRMKNFGEMYYVNNLKSSWAKSMIGNSGIMTVSITYSSPKAGLVKMRKDMDSKVNEIISKAISYDMNESDKELALHDYIISHTILTDSNYYQLQKDESTPYGVLMQGKGNSLGIASTMQLLLKKAGIESIVVTGGSQAWNIVKIGGQYYHLDVASDFWECDGKYYAAHGHYNLTDEENAKIHTWDRAVYPKCTSTVSNYFVMNKTIAYDPDQFNDLVRDSIVQVREYVSIKMPSFNEKLYDISAAINEISSNRPELDYVNEWQWNVDEDMKVINLLITYDYPREKLLAMKKETQDKVKEVVSKLVKPGMTDYEKELAFHDYIVNNARYDYENIDKDTVPFEEHDAYGVLVKRLGVCDSYAEAMKMLLNEAGVECIVVEGKAISTSGSEDTKYGHAWNIVKLDGEYYQFDATWDDIKNEDGSESLAHIFFNITDEEAARLYTWDNDKYPKCTSTSYNYYVITDRLVENDTELGNQLVKALNNREYKFGFKAPEYLYSSIDIERSVKAAFHRTSLHSLRYNWIPVPELGVVEIEFEY